MKTKQISHCAKRAVKVLERCLWANLSPPKVIDVKEQMMRRCPELFLAGCSSAEPASASFRQNKCNKIRF